jgi:hypothetical protein
MTKTKSSKRSVGKRTKPTSPDAGGKTVAPKTNQPREELCVFAFRLTEAERDAIHKTAGPAKASKFARTLLVAAARKDVGTVKAIMDEVKATA